MIAFPLRRMQSHIARNDLLWAITIASLYCNVLKFHFGYLLHPLADGTAQSCLFLCFEVCTSFLIMLKLMKLAIDSTLLTLCKLILPSVHFSGLHDDLILRSSLQRRKIHSNMLRCTQN